MFIILVSPILYSDSLLTKNTDALLLSQTGSKFHSDLISNLRNFAFMFDRKCHTCRHPLATYVGDGELQCFFCICHISR